MMENNNEKNELQIFNNEQFGQIRIMTIDGDDHFNLYDIGMGLGYTTKAKGKLYLRKEEISNLCERLDIKGFSLSENFINIDKSIDFDNTYVTEDAFYDLCLESDAKNARSFRKWVTLEVLPSLRKRGVYIMENAKEEVIDNEKLFGKRRVKNTFAKADPHEIEKLYDDCINYINDQYSTKDKIKICQSIFNGLSDLSLKLSQDAVKNMGKCYDISLLQNRVIYDKAKYQNKRNGGIKSSKTKEIDKQGRLISEQDEIIREQQNKLDFLDPDIEEFTVVSRHGFSVNYMTKTIIDDNGKMKTVTSDEYRRWQNNFPNEVISHEEHIDWNSKIYIWLRFDAIESMDCDNMCKSIIDQIARFYNANDNNVQIREATINKVVKSYGEGQIYYIIRNVE
ncbi:MAG TPA: hypothetical protein DEG71_00215 [Clostridiales bacterium]|nr:hypothetical protein [Clostridiales bacterium]